MKSLFMKFLFVCSMFLFQGLLAQTLIKGVVLDLATSEGLTGSNIIEQGTSNGAIAGTDGKFELKVDQLPTTLVISFIGYETERVAIKDDSYVTVNLSSGLDLETLTIVGSRFIPRTAITSAVPIDNIQASDLLLSGQPTFDKMLHYKVPSFNSTSQTISDATAHFDPADLRGLGPSRTLVLVNGKRKNASALVYINDTPGKGEVGVDMKSIPAAAIKSIEVLRDGASAQYGSDAIAGVINVILRDDYETTDIDLKTGISTEGDGLLFGAAVNHGFKLKNDGFIHLTASFTDEDETNRAPSAGTDQLFGNIFSGIEGREDLGASLLDGTQEWLAANPDMGMTVGQPQMMTADLSYNMAIPTAGDHEVYSFGGFTYRDGLSYALYRAPYWVSDDHNLLHEEGTEYQGFQPTFESLTTDLGFAVGIRGELGENWQYDLSSTYGGNGVDYTVNNSLNSDLGADSPTSFEPGGYSFYNLVNNLDVSRNFGPVNLALGAEFRLENFEAKAGDEASYFGEGAQSFPGIQPQNAVSEGRSNIGVYADVNVDVTEDFLIGGAVRFEDYSDFGSNVSWKGSARYKLLEDKLSLRGSVSTGFRAPSLHQRYLSIIQTLVSGGTVSNQGTFNNESEIIQALGIPNLKDETAFNISAGFAAKPAAGLFISADFYSVQVDDRVVYSSSVASSDSSTLVGQILNDNDITSLKFFANAVGTKTTGLDVVVDYRFDVGVDSKMGVSAALNLNETEINGAISTPAAIAEAGFDIFDRKEQSRLLTSRPKDKVLFGISFENDLLSVALNNTRFGEVTRQNASDPALDQTFSAKIVTDLNIGINISKKLKVNLGANNLFNVYPDKIDTKGNFLVDLGGRFQYGWEVNQFGYMGTFVHGGLSLKL